MSDLTAGSGLRHMALFYRTVPEYQAELAAFARAALAGGGPVLLAVPGERARGLREALGRDAGRAVFADVTELGRNPGAVIPILRGFVDRHPARRVSCLSELAWPGRTRPELLEATKHEALVNLAFAGTSLTLACPYDVSGLPVSVVADVERTHPLLRDGGKTTHSCAYLGAGCLPPSCTAPLSPVPARAARLPYETDLRPVRALVTSQAAQAGLPGGRVADLALAVSEVAANTLRHTGGAGVLYVWQARAEILCQLQDGGLVTDPLAGQVRPGSLHPGQQGLWIVNQVCDLVEMRTSVAGTTMRLHMRTGGERRASLAQPGELRE